MNGPTWWVSGRTGTLAPWALAKVWALHQVNEEYELNLSQDDIAKAVTKVGGGHPTQGRISKLLAEMDADPLWYPGKGEAEREKPGPKKVFTPQKQQAVANSAMALKRDMKAPTAAAIKARCPDATFNPKTQQPFTDKVMYGAMRTRCFDEGAEEPWGLHTPHCKTALSPELKDLRLAWGRHEQRIAHPPHWWHRNVIFVDPCHTIVTDRQRAGFDEQMASFGKRKRWMSPDAKGASRNLRASPYAGKQAQFGDKKIWWFIVMFRGKVHFEIMGDRWQQNGGGMAEFVGRLEGILQRHLGRGAVLPRIVFSDRGPGFYQSSTGHIVGAYFNALKDHGFRAYAGTDASKQAPDMPDVFPHETAVAWARQYMRKHPLHKEAGMAAMEEELADRLAECAKYITKNYNVDALCQSLPHRLQELVDGEGERLRY